MFGSQRRRFLAVRMMSTALGRLRPDRPRECSGSGVHWLYSYSTDSPHLHHSHHQPAKYELSLQTGQTNVMAFTQVL